MKLRKKPVVVEGYQWWKNGDHPGDGPAGQEGKVVGYYVPGEQKCPQCKRSWGDHGWVSTLEGGYCVCPGDWIITGVAGERYPVKPGIKEATYEEVLDDQDDM